MSYKLLSHRTSEEQGLTQWNYRSIEEEIKSFENRTIVKIFNQYLGVNARIIEGGCGIGAWCEWFKERGYEVIGIEYYEDIVKLSKVFKSDVAVEHGDIIDLKYHNNSFDAYLSLGVIEHFERGPELPLREAHRVLKPRGLIFLSIPYLNMFRKFIMHPIRSFYFLICKFLGKSSYLWEYRYTEKEILSYIEDTDFEIIHVDIDDYSSDELDRHIGLWADWFFLRKSDGKIWELNRIGRFILRILPSSWYCSGIVVVARAKKSMIILQMMRKHREKSK